MFGFGQGTDSAIKESSSDEGGKENTTAKQTQVEAEKEAIAIARYLEKENERIEAAQRRKKKEAAKRKKEKARKEAATAKKKEEERKRAEAKQKKAESGHHDHSPLNIFGFGLGGRKEEDKEDEISVETKGTALSFFGFGLGGGKEEGKADDTSVDTKNTSDSRALETPPSPPSRALETPSSPPSSPSRSHSHSHSQQYKSTKNPYADAKLIFGKAMRNSHFPHHSHTLLRLNNGGFGACPESVLNFQTGMRNQYLQNPDLFWTNFGELMFLSRWSVAEMLQADPNDLALIDNMPVASSVIAEDSLRISRTEGGGGVILISNFTDTTVSKAMHHACKRSDGKLHIQKVEIPFPVRTTADLMNAYQEKIDELHEKGAKLQLAALDHVSSLPSVLFPIKELVKMCREAGFERIFVDGCHALGTVADLHVPAIGADFYAGNIHTWMFAPTAAAYFWTRSDGEIRDNLHHPVIGNAFGGGFNDECLMVGERDYSSLLAVPAAVELFKSFGGGGSKAADVICRRNHDLVVMEALELAELWGTELGTNSDMCTSMVMLGLPACFGSTWESANELQKELKANHPIVISRCFPADGRLWVRLSAAVYNYREEYELFGQAINHLKAEKEGSTGEDHRSKKWMDFVSIWKKESKKK